MQEGRIARALDPIRGWEYVVAAEAFDERAEHIYRYESQQALARIERSCQAKGYPNIHQRKDLFQRVETAFIERFRGKPKNLRHVSFMLRELSEMGCDFLTASAALSHNFPRKEAERIMLGGQKTTATLRKTVDQILEIVRLFNEINGIPYSPPPKRLQHHIQNFLDALIKISRGNGRALLLFFIHKLSSLSMQTEDAADITFTCVEEFVAPSAERLGLIWLASKLRNEAFRLNDPDHYLQIEKGILESLGMSRKQAEDSLDEIRKKLEGVLSQSEYGLVSVNCRVKTPWGVKAKSESRGIYRLEDPSDIILMEDLQACRAVTKTRLSFGEAKRIIRQILGDDFASFSEDKTRTKYKNAGSKTAEIHHLVAVLKNGNSVEFQFMDKDTYQEVERGYFSHWAYKLELLTGQQFDRTFLECCARQMSGDILDDAEVIYSGLTSWIYVFFRDPRFTEDVFRAIRREKGSIPLDVVPWIIGKDISTYAGVKIRKVWDDRFDRSPEERPLEDGDFLELLPAPPGRKPHLSPAQKKSLVGKSRDPLTKLILHSLDEDQFEVAVQAGRRALFFAARAYSKRFDPEGLDSFAVSRYHMDVRELMAALSLKLIPIEEVLESLLGLP